MTESVPGLVVLFGSGEASPSGGAVYDLLARRLARPLRIALLETPAGFQPNAARVAGRVADFMRLRLQNDPPVIEQVPARRRGTPFSPDSPEVVQTMQRAGVLFLGPGSPTYTIRQLHESLAWHTLLALHRRGAALVTASAATLAISALALPVYEIYKVGADLSWCPGLNFFGPYGLELVFVPHWNNSEGGAELDTSHCYMGAARWDELLAQLPSSATVVGIDEHTALLIDLHAATCQVLGRGGVALVRAAHTQRYERNASFALAELGAFQPLADPAQGIPPAIWAECPADEPELAAPPAVLALVEQRQAARARRDWAGADTLRGQIAALGWQVRDTPTGPQVEPET